MSIRRANPRKQGEIGLGAAIVFVLTDDGEVYLIPSRDISTRTTINLCTKYERYRRAP